MSVPSSYSASELAAYMHGELGRVADALGFTAPASYGQAIVRTLTAYGVSSIASATNVPRLLALSSVEAWRLAVQQLTPQFNMVNVLDSLFKAVVSFTEGHVPWETCTLHEASNGKCYIYKIYDARTLVRSVVESSPEPARDAQ
jgi:hypothetical protein